MKKIVAIAAMVAFAMGLGGVSHSAYAAGEKAGAAPAEQQSDKQPEKKQRSNVHVKKSKKGKNGRKKGNLTKTKKGSLSGSEKQTTQNPNQNTTTSQQGRILK